MRVFPLILGLVPTLLAKQAPRVSAFSVLNMSGRLDIAL